MLRPVLFILLFFPAVATTAQEEFITPSRFITRMPFRQMTGGVILMKAQLNSFPDTLNFILDTGSGGISLDSTTVEYFKLKPEASNRTIRGIAGIRNVSFLYNQKLHFPGLTVDSLNFHVNDYGILTAVYGEQIDGIIGYSVLSRYILKINFDSTHIEFWTRGAMKYPRGGYLFRPFISTLPVQSARVRDDKALEARFLYDMGAGLNMLLTTDFIQDSSLLSSKRKMWVKEAEGLGGKIDMHMTVVKEVKLGPYKFRNVPVYVFDDNYNVTSYPYMGGLIGNDLLRRFNVVLNYEKRHFYLTPNSHFNDPFDYSYSGVELYYMDGEILLGDVAKGSPAEKAGLREGDVVVAVNRNFVQNLQLMKAALQNTNGTIRLIIRRDGELLDFDFKVKNILRH
ncbi:MAG TPA: aspartyl protease family protein [Chitinophagaceae bacterium]